MDFPAWLLLGLVLVAVATVLAIVALVGVAREPGLTPATRVAWVLCVVLLPFVGPLMWFAIEGRRTAPA